MLLRPTPFLPLALALAGCADSVRVAPDAATDAPADTAVAPADVAPPDVAPPDAAPRADTCRGPQETAWTSDPAMCLVRYADGLSAVRGLAFAPDGALFAVSRGRVLALTDADGDGVSSAAERSTFAEAPGLNHGLAFAPDGAYVYASSPTTVYRWPWRAGDRVARGAAEVVVTGMVPIVAGMPRAGGHATRTLAFDRQGRLLVSVGSAHNLDTDPTDLALRSMVRRFALSSPLPRGGIEYASGEVLARGMRNEVGLAVDHLGRIWGVENGRDELTDARFGGDIHDDNPAEELNRLDGDGPTHFGYPECWTEFRVPRNGGGPGAQHRDRDVAGPPAHDEGWCQDPRNNRRPAAVMPAHWAPLGLTEYTGDLFPAAWRASLIVAAHGSWNRTYPSGRLLARVPLSADGVAGAPEVVLGQRGPDGRLFQDVSTTGQWALRPVDVRQGPDGALYFSDDQGGRVFRVGYRLSQ